MNIDFDTLSEDYDFYKYRVSAKIFSDLIDKKWFKKVEVAEKMWLKNTSNLINAIIENWNKIPNMIRNLKRLALQFC